MKKYLKKHKNILILGLFFVLLQTSTSTILQFQKGNMVNRAIEKDVKGLIVSTSLLLLMILLEIGCTYFGERINNLFSFNLTMDLKGGLFKSIISKSIEDNRKKDTGHYISLFNNELNAIRMDFYESITYILFLASRIVFVFIGLAFLNLTIAAVALVTCFIPLLVPKIMKNVISKIKAIEYEELSNFNQYISDRLNGHRVIKIYGAEDHTNNEFHKINFITQSAIYKSRNLRVLLQVLSMICSYMSYFIVLGMSVFFVAKDILNVGEIFTVIGLVDQLSHPIVALSGAIAAYRGTKPLEKNIEKELNYCENKEILEFKAIDSIEFKDYSNIIENMTILKNINYTFHKGKKYLLIGESGSGKSTILKAINREYGDYKGEILADNIPIEGYNLVDILALVDQEPYIFKGSIEENIKLGREIENEELDKVLKLLELDNYSRFQNAYEMSGGEKMRISLARALVRNTPILLLDEISSSLDNKLGRKIEEYLLKRDDLTVLFVTHKVNEDFTKYYDDIIRFEEGKLVALNIN